MMYSLLRPGQLLLGLTCLFIGLLGAPAAHAQCGGTTTTCCLLPPVSVPGLYGAPDWYSGAPDERPELDDPRWGGAPLTPFASGGGTSAAWRAVVVGDELSVSFHALVDPTGEASFGDAVYIGISKNSSGSSARLLKITPRPSGTGRVFWNPGADFEKFAYEAGNWAPDTDIADATTPPSYLITDSVYTWRELPTTGGPTGGTPDIADWGLSFKINLAALVAGTTNFKMTFGMELQPPTGDAVPYQTPDTTTPATIGTTQIAPVESNPANWTTYRPRGSACDTTGVTISNYGIGSTSSSGENFVENGPNEFFANVQNIPAPISTGKVRARFSIANWGAAVADPDASWDPFSVSTNGDGYIPDGTVPDIGWDTDEIPGGAQIKFSCTPSGASYCPEITAISPNKDQCLLVELRPTPGAGGEDIVFHKAAARRNMLFEALSTVDREATISARGLEKILGNKKDRDIYLYVQTKNMPGHGNEPLWLDPKQMAAAKAYASLPPQLPRRRQDPDGNEQDPKKAAAGHSAVAKASANARAAAAVSPKSVFVENEADVPVLSPEQALRKVWPTYLVHAYYDTGKTFKRKDGVERRVLVPMVPFGMHFTHDGPLYGFSHSLRGLGGLTLEEVGPNFYKIVVKNEGSARVGVKVTAHEKPLSHSPGGGGGVGDGRCPCCKPPKVIVNNRGCYCTLPGTLPEGSPGMALLALLPLLVFARRRRAGQRSERSS